MNSERGGKVSFYWRVGRFLLALSFLPITSLQYECSECPQACCRGTKEMKGRGTISLSHTCSTCVMEQISLMEVRGFVCRSL